MRRVAVVGMGVTGRAVANALLARSIELIAIDDNPGPLVVEWGERSGVEVQIPSGPAAFDALLTDVDAVVPAPGLPDHHPLFDAASREQVPVLSEFDLAHRWDDRPAVAVTGTDGKTTVVTLITEMLNAAGIDAADVGNTDTPWVQAIDDPSTDCFVVEASSFRLAHSARFSPDVAVWLNFGPDHLDAHADLSAYETAKASIWNHLGANGLAIANRDDQTVARHARSIAESRSRVETFGASPIPDGAVDHGVVDGHLVVRGAPVVAVDDLNRRLPHDLLNALAATAAATAAGASIEACARVLRSFRGLPHRAELVLESNGVAWVNDSKATTPHATAAALGGYESLVLIAGGKNKRLSFDDMVGAAGRVRHVIAIGDDAPLIHAAFADRVATSTASSMQDAIEVAAGVARKGDTVLLSPACASFDWYRNYRERGDDFRSRVLTMFEKGTL